VSHYMGQHDLSPTEVYTKLQCFTAQLDLSAGHQHVSTVAYISSDPPVILATSICRVCVVSVFNSFCLEEPFLVPEPKPRFCLNELWVRPLRLSRSDSYMGPSCPGVLVISHLYGNHAFHKFVELFAVRRSFGLNLVCYCLFF
jgi:hypothetical protein